MCSTPFGIIGIHTDLMNDEHPTEIVLNAFRHHWNSHVLESQRRPHGWSAQRLSASLEFTLAMKS